MTRTQYYVAASLDGFIAAPGDDLDWLLEFGFEEFQAGYDAFYAGVGAIVMGSRTYEFVRESGEPWAYDSVPTWVLTTRDLPTIPGADMRFSSGSAAEVHAEAVAAAGERNVWIVGGGVVAAQWAEAGLLDELLITYMPVVLGRGAPLLPLTAIRKGLTLERTHAYPSGALEVVYRL